MDQVGHEGAQRPAMDGAMGGDPACTHLRHAVATRARRRQGDPVIPFEFGVFDSRQAAVDAARLRREWPRSKTINPVGAWEQPTKELRGTSVYGGVIIDQFGHFLLETLARRWFWQADPDTLVAFHCDKAQLLPWQRDILAAYGLPQARLHFITESTAFEHLMVPEPGYVISTRFHPAQVAALELLHHRPAKGSRVWLSRSRLGPGALGTFENEAELEAMLSERGWTVVHPQEMPFAEQIRVLAEAEVIAAIEGSAVHSIVTIAAFAGRLLLVPRTDAKRLNSRNYQMIATAKRVAQHVYTGDLRQVSGPGAFGRLAIESIQDCLNFIDSAADGSLRTC
jgi:hypothetical protein